MTHGFELHCDPEIGPNNLEINWGPGNHLHLEELTSASCSDDPSIEPPPPAAGFDTYVGTGTGLCNGVPGATISFTLTDAGEPGKNDTATFEITGCPGGLTLSVSGNLNKGNQQAYTHSDRLRYLRTGGNGLPFFFCLRQRGTGIALVRSGGTLTAASTPATAATSPRHM